jgi:hypothetical protein
VLIEPAVRERDTPEHLDDPVPLCFREIFDETPGERLERHGVIGLPPRFGHQQLGLLIREREEFLHFGYDGRAFLEVILVVRARDFDE